MRHCLVTGVPIAVCGGLGRGGDRDAGDIAQLTRLPGHTSRSTSSTDSAAAEFAHQVGVSGRARATSRRGRTRAPAERRRRHAAQFCRRASGGRDAGDVRSHAGHAAVCQHGVTSRLHGLPRRAHLPCPAGRHCRLMPDPGRVLLPRDGRIEHEVEHRCIGDGLARGDLRGIHRSHEVGAA